MVGLGVTFSKALPRARLQFTADESLYPHYTYCVLTYYSNQMVMYLILIRGEFLSSPYALCTYTVYCVRCVLTYYSNQTVIYLILLPSQVSFLTVPLPSAHPELLAYYTTQ